MPLLLRLPHSSKLSVSIPTQPPLHLPIRFRQLPSRHAHPLLRHIAAPPEEVVGNGEEDDDPDLGGPMSAAAVAAAIRRASTASSVQFTCARQEATGHIGVDVADAKPSADFQQLCGEQLEIFRLVVSRDAALSLYVRPIGSYTVDHQLELRRVALHPDEIERWAAMMLVANFSVPAGLRAAEALLVQH